MHTSNKEYETSLKSIETENYPDRWFYRPIGFHIAKKLRNTGITPNMVTIISIFVGAAAGPLFYCNDRLLILLGIISLIIANILDCVDGQLARLTGVKSEIGRLLDGFAGDIWFTLIYVFLALELKKEYGTGLFFIPAVIAGLSHLVQANITDYYKTLHLYFVSKEKGQEFHNIDEVRSQYRKNKSLAGKVLFFFYIRYTSLQESATPKLQQMLKNLRSKYGDDIPNDIRTDFRRQSKRLMKQFIDFMTFNGRTIVLFAVVLAGHVWIYFFYEIVILNIILAISIYKHEKICASFIER
ncbi:MAG: CDP-alcohol phosphatidyltransferase family protein [Tannerella sp.]|jgi:phosphatidylglycerophosphate synthase|nr:CDP-alcohol phosphatidyltransferase family protein [Tannerella sp.]